MRNKDDIYYVYEWYNAETGEVFYVGKGKGNRYLDIKHRNSYFTNYYNKHKESCDVKIIEDKLKEYDAFKKEKIRILELKSIGQAKCNLSDGGEGSSFDWLSDNAKMIYFAIISSEKKNNEFNKFGLREHKLIAINRCIDKYDIKSYRDILYMKEDKIDEIAYYYLMFSEEELDNIIGYNSFCDAILEYYDSIEDFWDSNI